ncbi:MAG: hypothetical protein U1C33_05980, partial [Candidatus Cloacimonadaceae bacterium]|nr:hypothetical protein [Candidatus Cloacimonadaceae bacterium]
MKRFLYILPVVVIIIFFVVSCSDGAPFASYRFELVSVRKPDTNIYTWIFADLNGDSKDEFIYSSSEVPSFHHTMVGDLDIKVYSQINTGHPIRAIVALKHPADGKSWLFYTFNDGRKVYLNSALYEWTDPLQRVDRAFELIPRKDSRIDDPSLEWFAAIVPIKIDDLDGDGRYELICRTTDSFTSNPRGIVVYDLETGSIKWQLDLPAVSYTLLVEDFTGDGKKEILYGTLAFKNNNFIMHDVDDHNGWIVLVNAEGKILSNQKTFTGYGGNYLVAADLNHDGNPQVIKLEATWGVADTRNSVQIMHWDGNGFRSQKSYSIESSFIRSQHNFFVEVDDLGTYRMFCASKSKGLILLDHELNEVAHSFADNIINVWPSGDLRGKGRKDTIIQTEDNRFVLLDYNARLLASLPNPFPEENRLNVSIVLNGFGKQRLVAINTPSQVRYYRIKPLPLMDLIYGYIHHYRKLINILVLACIILLGLHLYHIKSLLYKTIGSIPSGIMLIGGKTRIIFTNAILKSLLQPQQPIKPGKRLDVLMPEVFRLLMHMQETHSSLYTHPIAYKPNGAEASYNLTIVKVGGIYLNHIII